MKLECLTEWGEISNLIFKFFHKNEITPCKVNEYPIFNGETQNVLMETFENGDVVFTIGECNKKITLSCGMTFFALYNEDVIGFIYLDYIDGISLQFFNVCNEE